MIHFTANKYIVLLASIFTLTGCSTLGYYMDLLDGHNELVDKQQPVSDILARDDTSEKLRKLLEKSQKIRNYATKSLHLPENDSYRMYADLKRRYVVWNVVAAKEFSIEPKKWCFLFVGCLSYRGYFIKQDAINYASELKKQGYDVYVAGASAYSTLGWFDDPLLNTMMYKSEARRAGIIFHELAHQQVYIEDDSAFNEAFATAVEEVGVERWMKDEKKNKEFAEYLRDKQRDQQLNQLLKATREKLEKLYQTKLSDEEKRQRKQKVFTELNNNYQQVKKSWNGHNAFDKWMNQGLNNAHLLLIATYNELVPVFKQILKQQNNDLKAFYAAVEKYGELDKVSRDKKLKTVKKLLAKKD